jgi:hypothetical protein
MKIVKQFMFENYSKENFAVKNATNFNDSLKLNVSTSLMTISKFISRIFSIIINEAI